MEMKRREVEDVFGARYGIGKEHSVAFRGRLQHLQRLGFPHGTNTGRGRQAVYGWDQFILLGLALDLIDIGLPPDAAVNLLSVKGDEVLSLVAGSLAAARWSSIAKAIRDEKSAFDKSIIAVFHIHALSKLASPDRATTPTLGVFEGKQFFESVQEANPYESGGIWFDASTRLFVSIRIVSILCQTPIDALAEDLENWASSYV